MSSKVNFEFMNAQQFIIRSAKRKNENQDEDNEVHVSAKRLLEQMDEVKNENKMN